MIKQQFYEMQWMSWLMWNLPDKNLLIWQSIMEFWEKQNNLHLKLLDTQSAHLVSRLTGLNTANQFIISMNCANFNFVQCLKFFSHQISQADRSQRKFPRFPCEEFQDSVFLWYFLGKISRHQNVIVKNCWDIFTYRHRRNRHRKNISKAKQLSEPYCKLMLAKFNC